MMKILIGGLIMLVAQSTSWAVVGIALLLPYYGYWLQTLTQVRDGQAIPLPEWGNWGDLFSKGGMVFAIALIYNLPVLLLVCCIGGLAVMGSMGSSMGGDTQQAVEGFVAIMSLCLMCTFSIIMTLANFMLPAAWIRYAQTGLIGSAFEFGAVLGFIRTNLVDYLIVIVMTWVAGFIAGFGVILCGIGVFFTGFWGTLVSAHLYGQLAAKMDDGNVAPDVAPVGY